MDAAHKRELDELRRRAYGPGTGLAHDSGAALRLDSLEHQAQLEHAHELAFAHGSDAADDSGLPPDDRPPPGLPPLTARHLADSPWGASPMAASGEAASREERPHEERPRRGVGTAVTLAVAALALLAAAFGPQLGSQLGSQGDADRGPQQSLGQTSPSDEISPYAPEPEDVLTASGDAETVLIIPATGSSRLVVGPPESTHAPRFSTDGVLVWSREMGRYYGWELWIAGGRGGDEPVQCMALRRADQQRTRCASADAQRLGALGITLSADDFAPGDLPLDLGDSQRLRFWWLDEQSVRVVVGDFSGV